MKVKIKNSSGQWEVWTHNPWWEFWKLSYLLGVGISKEFALEQAQRNIDLGAGASPEIIDLEPRK